jgi:hypothetical protein
MNCKHLLRSSSIAKAKRLVEAFNIRFKSAAENRRDIGTDP